MIYVYCNVLIRNLFTWIGYGFLELKTMLDINQRKKCINNFCRMQTKLREGNVFTGVCLILFKGKGGPHVTITHDSLGH